MVNQPHVSVVSVFYNRREHVAASVESLLAQTLHDIEIVLVDDGSTDGTGDVLARYAGGRVRVVRHANKGFVAALSDAIAGTTGRYVAIHGSGDLSLPTRLERQAAVLDGDPRVGVVGCCIDYDTHVRGVAGVAAGQVRRLRATAMNRNPFSHGEVMYRRDLYDRVGGYRATFRYSQDLDLWLRMGLHADYTIVPEVLYRRFKRDDGVSRVPRALIAQKRLADFAVHCARAVDAGLPDPIEVAGPAAFATRPHSREVARIFVGIAVEFIRMGRLADGQAMVRAAREESRTVLTAFVRLFLLLPAQSSLSTRMFLSLFRRTHDLFRRVKPSQWTGQGPDLGELVPQHEGVAR